MSEKCPWCGEQLDYEALPSLEEECLIMCCDSCQKKFMCRSSVEYYMERNCEDNGLVHEWESYDNSDVATCKNCDQIK
jgi:hypothetical protein